jgi:phytol kinase
VIIDEVFSFFADNFPPWNAIALGGPLGLAWAALCLLFSGYLKKARGVKTGYTRKVFHFSIFGSVVVIQWLWGTPMVCLFGGMTTLVVFYAVFRGAGSTLYEAMAREQDEPHRTHYIVVPYFATLLGGLTSNIMFGELAIVGYLVTGFGDAIGEPVGTRFGRHRYRTPSFTSVESTRSLEGSLAVFAACSVAVLIGVALCPPLELGTRNLLLVPVLGLACAIAEAISPHGWDNATLLIVPSLLAWWLLSGG